MGAIPAAREPLQWARSNLLMAALSSGDRLGVYEILGPIGAGGMDI
jgi:hypothetical protein